MIRAFQRLLAALVLLAVISLQIRGVQAGYVCQCTGELSTEILCHGSHSHGNGHGHEPGQETPEDDSDDVVTVAPESSRLHPLDHHCHRAVNRSVIMQGHGSSRTLPPVVWFEIRDAFQAPLPTLTLWTWPDILPLPLQDNDNWSPSAPLLVARTVVRLI